METFYQINGEELVETKKDIISGRVTAFVHNGMYTLDGAFHMLERDNKPSIFPNESSFMATLHKEHPDHEVFNGRVIYPNEH